MKIKFILIIISITIVGFTNLKESSNNFEYTLTYIARNFKSGIMDKDECELLKKEADDLVDDIEDEIDKLDKYTSDEIIKLEELKKEAKALENFISAIGNCGSYVLSIEDFNLANRRVGAITSTIVKNKYCIDLIKLSIGDYIAYLGVNNSTKNYTVTYKWKAVNGMNNGYATMGFAKLSLLHIYNNRAKPSQKNISIFAISCKEF
ncbi:MAG: hypothetical protein WCK82_13750 [Bacteroidota bacterium]|jgi:hypothetical protein